MKTYAKMIGVAVLALGMVICINANLAAGDLALLATGTDKDDFDNADGDGVENLGTGDIVAGWPWKNVDGEGGNTDRMMYPKQAEKFCFEFDVALPTGSVLAAGALRLKTWNNGWDRPLLDWPSQPMVLTNADGDSMGLSGKMGIAPLESRDKGYVIVEDIPLTSDELEFIGDGGLTTICIGTGELVLSWKVIHIDYAELLLSYDQRGGQEPVVPEAGSAAAMLAGLVGLVARRKRRS
jgi:MYXO-CTERM domain-containing protein